MRFGLIDLLFLFGCEAIGIIVKLWLTAFMSASFSLLLGVAVAVLIYLILVCPFYRGLKLFPMILPRCPCCAKRQPGFHFVHGWPRVVYRCPTCNGEFVIWL